MIGLNNSKRVIDADGRTKILQKEAMYSTILEMGLRGQLKLFDNKDIKDSLRSITVEDNGRISGRWSHIVEGLIRAAELLKEKELNMRVYSIKV